MKCPTCGNPAEHDCPYGGMHWPPPHPAWTKWERGPDGFRLVSEWDEGRAVTPWRATVDEILVEMDRQHQVMLAYDASGKN